jgi:uncharacterized protein (DUF433 family)
MMLVAGKTQREGVGGMTSNLIHDRGRGPELVGTRITVYNLLVHFLEPDDTEAFICKLYDLTPEQVAAARAYVLNNPEQMLARHLEIEARMAAGNPLEVIEQARKTHETFVKFKEWLTEREKTRAEEVATESASTGAPASVHPFPSFHEWISQRESRPAERP